MKRVLVDAYCALNLGDDLFLKILFERYPNVNFELIHRDSRYKEVFKQNDNIKVDTSIFSKVRMKLFSESLVNKYDAIVCIGGSIFMQTEGWRKLYERRKRIINSFSKKNKPVFILGSNFGPYSDDSFVKIYEELFQKCEDVCFREQYSYDLFKHIPTVRMHPDIVFALQGFRNRPISNTIGISIMDFNDKPHLVCYRENYLNKMKELIEHSVALGKKISLFSFCEEQGDLQAINDLINKVNQEVLEDIQVVNYNGDLSDFLYKFSSMESMIGVRFHACILSQVFNQGLYPLIYSNKTLNVLKDIQLDQYYTSLDDLSMLDVKHVLNVVQDNKLNDLSILVEAEKQFCKLDLFFNN